MKKFLKGLGIFLLGMGFIASVLGAVQPRNYSKQELVSNSMLFTSGGILTGNKVAWINSGGNNIFYGPIIDSGGNKFITGGALSAYIPLAGTVGTINLNSNITNSIYRDNILNSIFTGLYFSWIQPSLGETLRISAGGMYFPTHTGYSIFSTDGNGLIYNGSSGYVNVANSGTYFNIYSGAYFQTRSGAYFLTHSGTYFSIHSGEYYNANISGSLAPYCLLSGNQTLTGTFHFNGPVTIGGTLGNATIDSNGVLTFTGLGGFTTPHGMRDDDTTQTVVDFHSGYVVTYSHIADEAFGMYLSGGSGGSAMVVPRNGDYEFIISAIAKVANNNDYFYIRARKNGVDIPNSNTLVRMSNANTEQVISVPFLIDMNAGDYIQFVIGASANGATMPFTNTGINPTRPATPSIIITAKRVSNSF